jgi:hypothetical protein
MTSLQASLTALIARMRKFAADLEKASAMTALSFSAPTIQSWADELASLVPSPPEAPMKVNTDPEQELAAHLLQELKPDCCCAVCEVLREWFNESFANTAPEAPEPEKATDGRSFHEQTHGKGWSLYGFKNGAINTGDAHMLVPSEHASELVDIHNKQVRELLGTASADAAALREQIATLEKDKAFLKEAADAFVQHVRVQADTIDRAEAQIATLEQEKEQLSDWRCTVTAALQNPGGAFYADVPKLIRELRGQRDEAMATIQAGAVLTVNMAASCKYCGREIRQHPDGAWVDREHFPVCEIPNTVLTRKHEPREQAGAAIRETTAANPESGAALLERAALRLDAEGDPDRALAVRAVRSIPTVKEIRPR